MKKTFKMLLIIAFILIIVFAVISKNKKIDLFSCDKQDNCCLQNDDCRSTNGGCFTKEWFAKESKLAMEKGLYNTMPQSTPNVICNCESNKCVIEN